MITFSEAQMNEFAKSHRANFIDRLAAHLVELQAGLSPFAACELAERALELGSRHKLGNEDEVAIVAEMMLAFGIDLAGWPAWAKGILASARPDKARRLRECLDIERRLAKAEA